ncbi:AraC family transcriptional regulator [Acidovorax sp. NCPPB 2350]|nr:AraC family transcriptional regulator [Acidovorax sp. NCPPB 2350]
MRNHHAEQDYRERVAHVVAFIVAHPMAEHGLEDLAAMAHFSPYHFHRVYRSVVGETVAATVRRVRLARATHLLEQGRESITQVALAVGYDSPQAFTRAFGQFTGQSPQAFQRALHQVGPGGGGPFAEGAPAHPLAVQVIDRPAQRVLALRHAGPIATIPHTQRRLYLACGTRAAERLGASYGDPGVPASGFRYYAAAVVPEPHAAMDAALETLDIPAGRYARHRITGPYARIGAAMAALYARWLPSSGYEPDDRPALEHYLNSPRDAGQADLLTDLLIPIRTARMP